MNTAATTRDPELTRRQILAAALELFVDQGFADVSMRQIAEKSGVTKSLIHHHFGSKDALWEATKEAALSRYVADQMQELEQATTVDGSLLRDGVIKYFRFLQDNPQVVRLLAWTHMEGDATCGEMDAALARLGAERVRQAQQGGVFRSDVNPMHVVTMFVLVCTQWFQARSHHAQWPGMGSDEEFLSDFLAIYMDGLAPPPAD
ncbi:TetR/AcrR family transcriptional regulator [Wenzhouxiangella sp. XN79A]|uniref:TetR/AcrR family transcriptional regulator n=1 Tax=Wenzhouxiangella sp. XN79A TaxID=2724193 RepID=UPI00144A57FB|nr:TetR/AcrR family transcriptional regulator [Wenzhouxiangella sp. XN79A]NKI34970.1 TetR/AcrR family transcriptional regulator [Wenzhouxiangella sp. XN79A]